MENYIKGKGILVGMYTEQDLKLGKDKKDVAKAQEVFGLSYTNQEFVKEKGQITALKIYVCRKEDFIL